ncbi:MAG: adenylate/guanylate cyclase domain-containing protein, partial [Kiloniellales bacterium]|nr:adenylate/guanylate cyclase domain-containing protein [Kiloniellales bacterium]
MLDASLTKKIIRDFGFGRAIALGMLAAFCVLRWWDPPPVEVGRLKVFDTYVTLHPRQPQAKPVVIIDIDEESLTQIGQWPWPRTVVAELVQKLTHLGVAGIAFDVVFAEPDRMTPARYVDLLPELSDILRKELKSLPNNDAIFARVLSQSPVVLGQAAYSREIDRKEDAPLKGVPVLRLGEGREIGFTSFPSLVRNLPELESAARGAGFFSLLPERDGIVRRIPLLIEVEGQIVPALSLELVRALVGPQMPYVVRSDEAGISSIGLAGIDIPTDRQGRMWVNYAVDDPSMYVSAKDILEGEANAELVKGRMAFVGTSAAGLRDLKSTPLDAALPGVAVHAQVLESFLTKDFLRRPHYALGAELVMLALVGGLMILLVPIFGARLTLLSGALVAVLFAAGSWVFFVQKGVLIDVFFPLLSALVLYTFLILVSYFREEAKRRQIRSAFDQYLSPELVDELAERPEKLVLGGETKELSVLFGDVRGFTSISENYRDDPQGLTSLLNRLLTPLSDAIMRNKGTIDKYMGDAIMAFWNAPIDTRDHARRACLAAMEMLDGVSELNDELGREAAENGMPFQPIKVGIGVNTGSCVVGNLGSLRRFDYSVIGDSVNVASRLEGLCKLYRVPLLISETTAAELDEKFATLEIDRVRVVGKEEPIKIFALAGRSKTRDDPEFQAAGSCLEKFFEAYKEQRW